MAKDERKRKRRRRRRGGQQAEEEEGEEEAETEEEEGEEDEREEERRRRHHNHKQKLKLVLKLPRSYPNATNTTNTATNSSSSSIPTTSLAAARGGAVGGLATAAASAGGLLSDTLSSPNPRRRERRAAAAPPAEEGEVHTTVAHARKPPPRPKSSASSLSEDDEDDDDDENGEKPPKKRKLNAVAATSNGSRQHLEANAGSGVIRRASNNKAEKQNQIQEVTDSVPGISSDPGAKTPLPEKKLVEFVLDKLQKKDTYGVFSEPVDPEELPDYHEVIRHPMDFGTVRKKLAKGVYAWLEELEKDVFLICTNAMHYNASDTIYFKQARAIQELAKKKFQSLRVNLDGIEAELRLALKTKPGYSSKKARRPGPGRPPSEPPGSDFSSGAILATVGDHSNWSNASLQDSTRIRRAATAERPGNVSGYSDIGGRTVQGHRNADALGPLTETKADKSEELSASALKAPSWRNSKRPLQVDENRRATYKPVNQKDNGNDAIFAILDGESKQLVPVPIGIRSEYAYGRSLARFAANAGPVAWKIAAQKIQRALPIGIPFGPGWVGDNENSSRLLSLREGKSAALATSSTMSPIVNGESKVKSNTCTDTPMLRDGGLSKNLISECRSVPSTTQVASVKHLVSNSIVCQPPENRHSRSSESDTHKNVGLSASAAVRVNEPPHEVKQGPIKKVPPVATSNDLSLTSTKFGSEVTQSRLLEMVSRNNTLVHGPTLKQTDMSNPINSLQVMHSETMRSDGDARGLAREASDASKHICSPAEPNAMVTRVNPSLHNYKVGPGAFQASQGMVSHGNAVQKPNSVVNLMPGKMLALHQRGSSLSATSPIFVNSSPPTTGPSIKRDDPTVQAWIQSHHARLADADASSRNKMQSTSSPHIEQHESQPRDFSPIARIVPKEIQIDMNRQALPHFSRFHSSNSAKFNNNTSVSGPVVESQGLKTVTSSYVHLPVGIESSKSHMQSWRGLPSQFLPEQASEISPSKPPDLNVGLQKPKSPGRQSSGMLADSQQPDLALQL